MFGNLRFNFQIIRDLLIKYNKVDISDGYKSKYDARQQERIEAKILKQYLRGKVKPQRHFEMQCNFVTQ